jgi:hypothetical protein
MMEGLKITGVTLTPQAASDILQTGVDAGLTHGFGYWGELKSMAELVSIDGGPHLLSLLVIVDHEGAEEGKDPKTFHVDLGAVQRAVGLMLMDPGATQSEGWTSRLLDDSGPDGPLADAIIQVACHGKVIYG